MVDDYGTSNTNAITSDLDTLGLGYTEIDSSDVSSAADLSNYGLVIWCPPYSTSGINSTEASYLISYIDSYDGNVFVPFSHWRYVHSTLRNRGGVSYYYGGGGTWPIAVTSGYVPYSFPGEANMTRIYGNSSSTTLYWYTYQLPNTTPISRYTGFHYYRFGAIRDNGTTGDHKGMCGWMYTNWNYITGTTPSSLGRANLLKRIIYFIDPSFIP